MTVQFDKYFRLRETQRTTADCAGYITSAVQEWPWPDNTDTHNAQVLTDFYAAVDWLKAQGWDEYYEENSNTINPVQQHAFLPLREYRVKRNGHYRWVKIYQRFFGGCYIKMY